VKPNASNSYIYGQDGLPVEQVSSGGTVTYLHHDQQGSTRLLSGSAGTVTGECSYGAYGAPTCEGTTTTPLGYDAQYTSSDTGLVYMRARELAAALKQCKKQPKKKRASCDARAKKLYGPKTKKRTSGERQ
jgi:hypothetical protein